METPRPRSEHPLEPKAPAPRLILEPIEGTPMTHIVLGTPDDDGCDVCRAHPGGRITEAQLRTCPCSMCRSFRGEV